MVAVPLGQGAFKRLDAPPIRLRNLIYERLPANLADQVSLIPRPALDAFASLAPGGGYASAPIRGIYRRDGALGGAIFMVVGSELFRMALDGTVTRLGSVGAGTAPVSMAANIDTLLVVGSGNCCAWDGGFSIVSLPEANPTTVTYLAGRFVLTFKDLPQFYWSAVNLPTFDPLDFATAELHADNLSCAATFNDELLLIGTDSIECWAAADNSDLPFQRIPGRSFSVGTLSPFTVALLEGEPSTLYFVGSDRQAYAYAGSLSPIGDSGLTEALATADLPSLRAWTYRLDGHAAYVLGLTDHTPVLDASTGLWSEFDTYPAATFAPALGCTLADRSVLCCSGTTNQVWKMNPAGVQDGGQPIVREFSGALVNQGGAVRCDTLQLDCSVGTASTPLADPVVQMSFSEDAGKTWTSWRDASLGRQGAFSRTPAWTRLGLIRGKGRIFRWRVSDSVRFSAYGARMNDVLR